MFGRLQKNAASFIESNYERTLGTVVSLIPELNWSSIRTDAELLHSLH